MTAQPKKSPPCPKNCPLSKPLVAQMKLNAQLDVAQKPTGSAVPITDTVPPPLMTAQPKKSQPCPKNCMGSKPPVVQMKLNAQLDVAQKPTGSVVPITDTVPPPLMTAQPDYSPPCPKNCLSSKPLVAQMKLNAQLDVAQKPTGSAVPTTDTVPPPLMTAQPSDCPICSKKCLL